MKTIEQALQTRAFAINPAACYQAAAVVRSYTRPTHTFPWSPLPSSDQLTFKLAFISVCHQFNWDFMQNRLAAALLPEPAAMVERLANVTARQFSAWLAGYPRPERIRAPQRVKLLRDLGQVLIERWEGRIDQFVSETDGRLGGPNGMFQALEAFEAYRADPLRKKSNILVHDLVRESILRFEDEALIEPAVDYHLIRLYLRSGRVIPRERALEAFLEGRPRPRPRLVHMLREAVAEAAKLTAYYASISIPDLNYVEWQIGRTICLRTDPVCEQALGVDIPSDIAVLIRRHCPYQSFCEAYNREDYKYYEEPRFEKTFY